MIKETMTSEQRLLTAVNLGIPDRVPIAPLIGQFACRQKGAPILPMGGGTPDIWPKVIQAIHETFDDLGGYDAQYAASASWPISSWHINSAAGGGDILRP